MEGCTGGSSIKVTHSSSYNTQESVQHECETLTNLDLDAICVICCQSLNLTISTKLGIKAIGTFITASKRRCDFKYRSVENLSSLKVHKNCYARYIRESSIQAAEKCHQDKQVVLEGRRGFSFGKKCIFCEGVSKQSIKQLNIETVEKIISKLNNCQLDDFQRVLSVRMNIIKDAFNQIHPFYHIKCYNKFFHIKNDTPRDRPLLNDTANALYFVINYITTNTEECQFSLLEILKKYGDHSNMLSIKLQLKEHFGDEVVIENFKGDYHICFRAAYDNIITERWYYDRADNEEAERQRIVKAAANIILQDIRSCHYDTLYYKKPPTFVEDSETDIPKTLHVFLKTLIHSHKNLKTESDKDKWQNKLLTIAHILISYVRPTTFVSQILLGISLMMHKKDASRALIDCLSNLNLCASYDETLLFEAAIVKQLEDNCNIKQNNSFVQFIFDHADHSTNIIDGRDTFHAMGGIMAVAPASAVTPIWNIERLKELPPAKELTESFSFLPISKINFNLTGLSKIKIKPIDYTDIDNQIVNLSGVEFLWLFAKTNFPNNTKGWLGFRECHSDETEFYTTKIIPMRFANAPPRNYDTILSVLIESVQKSKAIGQDFSFVTFDQPLYWKAREIIASVEPDNDIYNIRNVVVRLGGFHTLMSFLDSIGYLMDGSGLKEAFCILFADNSAEKAFQGHAFSDAIRGHTLNFVALGKKILDKCSLSDDELNYLTDLLKKDFSEKDFSSDERFKAIISNFQQQFKLLKDNGPTAQLFLQYFQCVLIVLNFYNAERSGDFKLHLKSIKDMIPYFYATGHNNYAKSALLYYQDMMNLKELVGIALYNQFAGEGSFTIRRNNKFWSGIWSDMCIEQDLMRAFKIAGEMSHGCNITDSTVAKWIACSIVLSDVTKSMENFCSYSYVSNEQHVDNQTSRINRDAEDLKKLVNFYSDHDPFPMSDKIYSIYSGLIGDASINCHKAYEVGLNLLKNNVGETFGSLKFSHIKKTLPLSSMNNKININKKIVIVQPQLIFQRIATNVLEQADMSLFLRFELAPYPLSIFDEAGMQKSNKNQFIDLFNCISDYTVKSLPVYIIEGEFLLQQITWQFNESIINILNNYIEYVTKTFSKNSIIVFDDYNQEEFKKTEQLRRKNDGLGKEISISENTRSPLNHKEFLINTNNKKQLINLLIPKVQSSGFRTIVTDKDVDLIIVETAIETSKYEENVLIVADNVEVLIILTQLTDNENIIYQKITPGKTCHKYYNVNSFKIPELRSVILFLYIFTGCDSTSAFCNVQKSKILMCMNKKILLDLANSFYSNSIDKNILIDNGIKIIKALYSTKIVKEYEKKNQIELSLNDLRYYFFKKSTSRASFKLHTLPPTEKSAAQHCLRSYLQLQSWLGNSLNPIEYGWRLSEKGFEPLYSTDPMIPVQITEKISCKCPGNCRNNCSCRKHGLKCSRLCGMCNGEDCSNAVTIEISVDDYQKVKTLPYADEIENTKITLDTEDYICETGEIAAMSQPFKKRKLY